uniref:Glutamate carboxypeptidase n=1 Tax=Onygena corvina TaxID=180788 RepID=A0A0B4VKZ4_9EURO|nr:glutamate carboxypeptidase [Onygena corvina]
MPTAYPVRTPSLPPASGLPQRPSFGAPQVNAFQMQQLHHGQVSAPPSTVPIPADVQNNRGYLSTESHPGSVSASADKLISEAAKQAKESPAKPSPAPGTPEEGTAGKAAKKEKANHRGECGEMTKCGPQASAFLVSPRRLFFVCFLSRSSVFSLQLGICEQRDMEKAARMPRSHETTPLLWVEVAQRPPRYPHGRLRRACTACLATTLVLSVIVLLLPFALLPRGYGSIADHLPWTSRNGLDYASLQQLLQTVPNASKTKEWSQYYTSGPHLAGKNLSMAIWTKTKWEEFGVADVHLATYDVYLNYPVSHRLALLEKDEKKNDIKVTYEASLEEDVLEQDATSGLKDRIPTFHGYSASGNVTARYVYVNAGTHDDYEALINANITLEGKIALVKYSENMRGLKVKRAQELGMVGVVIYTDPQEDKDMTELNGHKAYPDGPARNPSSVQRGSVQFLSNGAGDPTTPGYPSNPGCPREDPKQFIPSIPSLPISYEDALPLLKALNGHGPKGSDFSKDWQGGLVHKGIDYNIGPSPENVVINLYNEQEYVTTPIWNVIGTIPGSIPDEVIVLGNHRDAWIAGGAGDPNSGSAILNEVIRSFGEALRGGWKPKRTIVFASWDGEEYGLIGSTEWVEENLPWLSRANVAYLNVDVGVSGKKFEIHASPLLNKAVFNAAGQVLSPNQTVEGQTVLDLWDGEVGIMGSGSDFTAFQDFAGIPCVDYGFTGGEGDAVYHYHSNYDSFDWMDRYGDRDWQYHITMARVWALTAAYLSETPVLALNATDYAVALEKYLDSIKKKVPSGISPRLSFASLDEAISAFRDRAIKFDAYTESLAAKLDKGGHWWSRIILYFKIRFANQKYKLIERKFLYKEGLDKRSWFKHVVFAPDRHDGYAGAAFPGLVESLYDKDIDNAEVSAFLSPFVVVWQSSYFNLPLTPDYFTEMARDYYI